MKLFKSILIAAAVAVTVSFTACNGSKEKTKETKPQVEKADGTNAPVEETDDTKVPVEETEAGQQVTTIVDFNATWCGPCKQFAPIFEAAAEEYGDRMEFLSVDIDENPDLASQYGVESIPTVVFLDKDGNVVDQFIGLVDADTFTSLIEKHL